MFLPKNTAAAEVKYVEFYKSFIVPKVKVNGVSDLSPADLPWAKMPCDQCEAKPKDAELIPSMQKMVPKKAGEEQDCRWWSVI